MDHPHIGDVTECVFKCTKQEACAGHSNGESYENLECDALHPFSVSPLSPQPEGILTLQYSLVVFRSSGAGRKEGHSMERRSHKLVEGMCPHNFVSRVTFKIKT